MAIDLEKLKAAALAANQAWMDEPYEIEPALVLELIERLEAAEKQRDELLNALDDAATSLETIAVRSYGESSHLDSTQQMRDYAGSRAGVARKAIASVKDNHEN